MTIGNINGDEDITAADVIMFMQYFLNRIEFTEEQLLAADVTGDGIVNLTDLATLKQFCVGDKGAEPLSKLQK